MFKSAIYPIQAWLLSQGRCVGCGRELSEGKSSNYKSGKKVVCQCNRVFIRDGNTNKYRRALLNEA